MMKNFLGSSIILLFFCLFFLVSCSTFSPIRQDQKKYLINSQPLHVVQKHRSKKILLVTLPESASIYDTTSIAYTLPPHRIGYFSKSQWADTPAEMLQPLIVQTLQRTHYFKAILTSPPLNNVNVILNTQLIELQQEFTTCGSVLQLILRAQLINAQTGNIIATQQFSFNEPVSEQTPLGGIVATNRVAVKLLNELAYFTLKNS